MKYNWPLHVTLLDKNLVGWNKQGGKSKELVVSEHTCWDLKYLKIKEKVIIIDIIGLTIYEDSTDVHEFTTNCVPLFPGV